jgi:hypothetical protein
MVVEADWLAQGETDRIARTLSAWSVTNNLTIAAMTALCGLLASIISPHVAIAGVHLLATPLLVPPARRHTADSTLSVGHRYHAGR